MNDGQSPLVSILIPTYNQSEFIMTAVGSALSQDYPNLEILVVDDCSTDATYDVVMTGCDDARLKIFRNECNLGRVKNYRHALECAVGEWVINLDGDDYYTNPHYISDAMSLIREDNGVVLVFGKRLIDHGAEVNEDKHNSFQDAVPRILNGNDVFLALSDADVVINHMTCLYRRDLAVRLDFYRYNILSADWESIYRLVIGQKVGFLNEVAGAWRCHGGNASRVFCLRESLSNYQLCCSLFEAARQSGQFSQDSLREWRSRLVARKLQDDFSLASRYGCARDMLRLLRKGYSTSFSGTVRAMFSRSSIRSWTRMLKKQARVFLDKKK